jgi:hypothetical protein
MALACAQGLHRWEPTMACGWFKCRQIIDMRIRKGVPVPVYCDTLGYCPGCLGRHVSGPVVVAWCPIHEPAHNDAIEGWE